MTVTSSVRETRQINPFQELGYAWSSHAGSDRSSEQLVMCPGARSGPRGKKVYIHTYTARETIRKIQT